MSVAAHCANHSELVLYHSDILQPSALPSNTTDQAGNRQWHKQRVPSEVLHQAQGINWQSLCGDSLAVIVWVDLFPTIRDLGFSHRLIGLQAPTLSESARTVEFRSQMSFVCLRYGGRITVSGLMATLAARKQWTGMAIPVTVSQEMPKSSESLVGHSANSF